MPDQLQLRGGTTTEHNSFTGAAREVTVDTTKKTLVVHDGSQAGGTPLMKESGATAASSVQIGTGGVERFKITSSEVVFNETSTDTDFRIEGNGDANLFKIDAGNDRIGIGISSPVSKLHIDSATNYVDIALRNTTSGSTGTDGADIFFNNNLELGLWNREAGSIRFATSSAERLRIDSSGNVGINETAPSQKLHVGGDIQIGFATPNDSARQINFNVNRGSAGDTIANINWQWNNKFVAQIRGIAGIDTTNKDDAHLGFFTSSANNLSERLRIARDGNVGIGTTSPRDKLEIKGANSGYSLRFDAEAQFPKLLSSDNTGGQQGGFRFATDNGSTEVERMRIDSSGNVGIGNSSPQNELHIGPADNSNHEAMIILNNGGASGQEAGIEFRYESGTTPRAKIHVNSSDTILRFSTADNERMRIDGSGNVGIGTTSPSDILDVVHAANTAAGISIRNTNNSQASAVAIVSIQGGDNASGRLELECNGQNHNLIEDSLGNLAIEDNGTERMRLDSSGRFLLNMSTSVTGGKFQVNNQFSTFFAATNDATGCILQLEKTRSTSPGSYTIVQDGDKLGELQFKGSNGSASVIGANIQAIVNGTPGSGNDLPTDLAFRTMPDGSGSTIERMRIHSSGIVTVGDSAGSGYGGQMVISTSTGGVLTCADTGSGERLRLEGGSGIGRIGTDSNHDLVFITNGTSNEHMRIDSSGRVGIGTTSMAEKLIVVTTANTMVPLAINDSSNTSTSTHRISVRTNGTEVGSIKSTNNATTFNTSSDYRLKENAVAISDGITRLKTLKPYRFNFKNNANKTLDGFFAHEVTAVPEAVDGVKDEVATQDHVDMGLAKEIGNPIYQSIDHSKLVPLLVAAVQELIGKVAALEAA